MKKITVGILAHVDAGKTTLSESMLYLSGKIKKLGRVDNKDAYLDTYDLEKLRGITIFSKQALMEFDDKLLTLLDTPGHVDFSAEMERTLQVLDYAILVISGSSGVQNHTKTVWELLKMHRIPTFIFVNKMDQDGSDKGSIMASLHKELSDRCMAFENLEERDEMLALCDDRIMDTYLDEGSISDMDVTLLVQSRKAFPVYFGSALKQDGIEEFVRGFLKYVEEREYSDHFAAKIFKISRDPQGNRLSHMKVTGGSLKIKDTIGIGENEEKVNQIRIYSGSKFSTVNEVSPGTVCALVGLNNTVAGQGLGLEIKSGKAQLEPVLSYQVILPEDIDERQMLAMLRELEEEEPELRVFWNEVHQSIHIQVMGLVQLEIIESIISERFGVDIRYGKGEIVYKETILDTVEGVGHFEPLRHYSEVHLMLEPLERGSGMIYDSDCSEDILGKNWQNLVVKHLNEKPHKGVLTGSYITDMKVTLVTGRAHNKHTAGGDFRQASFRALRQGLMEAKSILLEPYYRFRLYLPEVMVGKAMTDIDMMRGKCEVESSDGNMSVIVGKAPVSTMQNYQHDVYAYTKGEGRLSISLDGYDVCHNSEEIIDDIAYDSELDVSSPTGSVFCTRGAGYYVPWDQVKSYMHVDSVLKDKVSRAKSSAEDKHYSHEEQSISLEEIDAIINKTQYSNQGRKNIWKKNKSAKDSYYSSLTSTSLYSDSPAITNNNGEKYILVDGYNIIHAWSELAELAKESLEASRMKLMDILSNYQPICRSKIMLVFDAYKVKGGIESTEKYHNIDVVFTKEAQTADHYIEKFAREHKSNFQITVATSDGLEQIIIRGAGARLLSARDLENLVNDARSELEKEHLDKNSKIDGKLEDILSSEMKEKLLSKASKSDN